jgi:hypothetical protein
MYFVYLSRKYVPLKIRTFVDFIMESTARDLRQRPNVAQAPTRSRVS